MLSDINYLFNPHIDISIWFAFVSSCRLFLVTDMPDTWQSEVPTVQSELQSGTSPKKKMQFLTTCIFGKTVTLCSTVVSGGKLLIYNVQSVCHNSDHSE